MKVIATIFTIGILFTTLGIRDAFSANTPGTNTVSGSNLKHMDSAPPCTGRNPRVAVPGGPHGMFAWAPGERMTALLKKHVIGKDPTLCGASIVVPWAELEKQKGAYD